MEEQLLREILEKLASLQNDIDRIDRNIVTLANNEAKHRSEIKEDIMFSLNTILDTFPSRI